MGYWRNRNLNGTAGIDLHVGTETWVPFFIGTMTDPNGDMTTVPQCASYAGSGPGEAVPEHRASQLTGWPLRHMGWRDYTSVDRSESPQEDDQSNFGTGRDYQRMSGGTIEVNLGRHWIVFEQIT